MQLEPGAMLSERLTLVAPIGSGGMGSVWIAENTALGTRVAVKVLSDHYADNDDAIARFRAEARALARVTSDHVVRIYDFATLPDGRPYMIMELLDGEDLEKLIRRVRMLTVSETATIVSQTCAALAKIHEAGVVHRDVKPENLFLTRADGSLCVKLFDFGIAKERASDLRLTRTGTTVGTPLYMSPEQILGGPHVDARCDLWGLAVVAYHALTGVPPFEGETYGALCVAIHRAKFSPPSSTRSDLPRALDAWFVKAFARDVSRRFATPEELAHAFAEACGLALPSTPAKGVVSVAPLARDVDVDSDGMAVTGPSKASRRGARGARGRAVAVVAAVGLAIGGLAYAGGAGPMQRDATALAERVALSSAAGARLFPTLAAAATPRALRAVDRAALRRGEQRASDDLGRAYPRDDANALESLDPTIAPLDLP